MWGAVRIGVDVDDSELDEVADVDAVTDADAVADVDAVADGQ